MRSQDLRSIPKRADSSLVRKRAEVTSIYFDSQTEGLTPVYKNALEVCFCQERCKTKLFGYGYSKLTKIRKEEQAIALCNELRSTKKTFLPHNSHNCEICLQFPDPITTALDYGCADSVEYLLQQTGLDLSVKLYEGRSVGHCAVEYKSLKEYCPEEKNATGFPVKCVELLSKDSRVDWNVKNDRGETPIMVALKNKEKEMVKILLRTPGVFLGDFTKTKEGENLLKEILQEAEDQRRGLTSKVPDCPVSIS